MTWLLALSTLLMGFAGSFHCGLMCGPISCSIKDRKLIWSYHLGRLISYLTMAALLHLGFRYLINLESRLLKISIAGLFLVTFILFSVIQAGWVRRPNLQRTYLKFFWTCRNWLMSSPFLLGLMTGLFPCGWLHTFVFFSSQMPTLAGSLSLILIFWLSSLPILVTVNHTFQAVLRQAPARYQRIAGFVLIFAGFLSLAGHWLERFQ